MRRRLGSVLAGVVLVAAGAGLAGASAVPLLHFPRDHFGHPQAGIEWWYVTGLVQGRDGRRYSVFFTLFSRGGFVIPVSQVVDLGRDAVVGHSEQLARATVGTTSLDVSAGGARLAYAPETNTWRFAAASGDYSLDLSARPTKSYVLHGGGTGVLREPFGGPSEYYSATRASTNGTLASGGRTIPFSGEVWIDHEWGTSGDPRAFNWYWFSCRFSDRTELMLYRFHARVTGAPLSTAGGGTFVRRNGTSVQISSSTVSAGTQVLHAAGHDWPLVWNLGVPSLGLHLRLRSLARNQLFAGALVPTFWEGASSVTGSKSGACFVEETYR